MTIPISLGNIESASVALLRRLIGFPRNRDRLPSGLTDRLQRNPHAAEPFQVWRLYVRPDNSATLACEDGNSNTVYTQEIEYTDFPICGITLWFSNGVIYLPSEH